MSDKKTGKKQGRGATVPSRPAGRRPAEKGPVQQSRKQRSRLRKDQRRQITVFAFVGVVAALLIGTLAWGWYDKNVRQPNEPIAAVNGQGLSTSLYQAMVRYQRFRLQQSYLTLQGYLDQVKDDPSAAYLAQYWQSQLTSIQSSLQQLPWTALEDLIDTEIVKQNVAALGIAVPTDEEVDYQVGLGFGYFAVPPTPEGPTPTHPPYPTPTITPTPTTVPTATATATPTPTPTIAPTAVPTGTPTATPPPPTPEPTPTSVAQTDFAKEYSSWLQTAGISSGDLREIVRRQMLVSRATEALQARLRPSAPQVHVRHIQFTDVNTATVVLSQAKAIDFTNNPEGFANLAKEVSEDYTTQEEGGDLGWSLRELLTSDYGAAFADAAFSLVNPGDLSDVVQGQTTGGTGTWHIIQLIERDPDRAVDGNQWDTLQQGAYSRWLSIVKETAKIERYFSSDKVPQATPFLTGTQ